MARNIEAVYENGVLKPPISPQPEGTRKGEIDR
jgi:predicted DNA-binding antitoxin AbrB/MazE fold protein